MYQAPLNDMLFVLRELAGLEKLAGLAKPELLTINLGTGNGTSVLQLVNAFIHTTGQSVPYVIASRRAGDIATCYASSDKAKNLLGWTAEYDIERMCVDTWRWQSQNPRGYHA